ncbi:polysaccharide lyase family 8 super-sandwich domain-containing protein [Paenibacillus flagellatus]|uniref:Hyaluronate lyase n=1 Tax=Paenibacillus flagellatus TaxID=2211139 RepID=A0A2V5JXD4_9BACL|nr:polysaccharide lyase family 8 super-sandwich domain-containing protein [Paenibacillus flagellatus]PYI51515.1 hyaluronate lyase [Paenibacillus flagellatus]
MRKMLLLLIVFAIAIPVLYGSAVSAADEYDALRLKWRDYLTGGTEVDPSDPDYAKAIERIARSVTNAEGTGVWDRMNKAPDRGYLWSDLTSTTNSAQVSSHYTRLKEMALAFATPGSPLFGDERLKNDIVGGLDWTYANRYNERKSEYNNWWDWEIGSPMLLADTMTLMYDHLSATQIADYVRAIDKFCPDPTKRTNLSNFEETGANRLDKALIVVLRGIVTKSAAKIEQGRDAMSQVFPYVTKDDGFYRDGSFVFHDNLAYTGSYGSVLLGDIAKLLYLLTGSSWQVTDPNLDNAFRWVTDSFEPLVYRGVMMDMVNGRSISRKDRSMWGPISTIAWMAEFAPPDRAAEYKRIVKGWLTANPWLPSLYEKSGLSAIRMVKSILNDPAVQPKGSLIMSKPFAAMDRYVHLRPGFGFGISMSSARIANFESGTENLKGWYTGDGMTYLYNSDIDQFFDGFWPTVDAMRLPGTTSDGATRRHLRTTSKTWVGGSSIDGLYGTAGMDLDPDNSTLGGKKSWFLFDDEIVALGAGLTSTDNRRVETIVENRMIAGDNAFTVNGEAMPSELGWSETMESVSWAHLAGSRPGADIGYYFPDRPTVNGLREQRTGSWSDINTLMNPTEPITRNYLSLSLDHGTNPSGESYSYVLLPNRDAASTGSYGADPDVGVLSNTERLQAVRERKLGVTGLNFWQDGTYDFVRSYQPASVMIKEDGDELTVAVSDPTMLQEKLTIELGKSAVSVLSADETVAVTRKAPYIRLDIDTAGSLGRTHTVKLRINPASRNHLPDVNRVTVDIAESRLYRGDSANVAVTVTNLGERTPGGTLELRLPDGWTANGPLRYPIRSLGPDESATVTATVYVPSNAAYARHRITAVQKTGNATFEGSDAVDVVKRNVAAGKPASQSSTAFGGVPERAVDGNTNGAYSAGSVSHTAPEAQPYWQTDLGADYLVDEIVLWNRTDCCSNRLSQYYVFVSDRPFESASLADTLRQPDVWSTYESGTAGRPTAIEVGRTGRYVRVQLSGTNPLSLAEVQVISSGNP